MLFAREDDDQYRSPAPTNEQRFNQEFEVLSILRNSDNPHLIKPLATFYQERDYFVVFQWPNGNLGDYWRCNPNPQQSCHTSLWIAKQCVGIAKAIHWIHDNHLVRGDDGRLEKIPEKTGRHGDVRRETILWFPSDTQSSDTSQEVLALSDFGVKRFLSGGPSFLKSCSTQEFDADGSISPSWDTWALGCVYVEFLIWYLQGWEALDKFSKQRRKHYPHRGGDVVVSGYLYREIFGDHTSSILGAYPRAPVIQVSEPHGEISNRTARRS